MNAAATRCALAALSGALVVAGAGGCRAERKPPGQLVVSIHTDMSLPQQVDNIRVQVLVHGRAHLDQEYPVGMPDDETRIPATLTLLAGKDPSVPVTIRVSGGRRNGEWRTFREVITTVPADRTAFLRMPVQWLCDGTARTGMPSEPGGRPVLSSSCGDGNSCVAGRCVPSPMPIEMLPDYTPQMVFGGAADPAQGTCFDTVACMSAATVVEPRLSDCTIERPAGVRDLNVALRVPRDGICDPGGTSCFIPLDAESPEGWTTVAAGDRLSLPPAVCERMKRGAVSGIAVSTACPAKTGAIPPCGPWSSVRGATSGPATDGGAGPTAEKVLALRAERSEPAPCCPLMTDGSRLLTCLCAPGGGGPRLVAIDVARKEVKSILELGVSGPRTSSLMAAAALDGAVFWVDATANVVHQASLAEPARRFAPIAVEGEITEGTPLLADAGGLYLLASAVRGAQGSPVQLVKIDRASGAVRSFDTGANFHVHQFAQDATSLYVASDLDAPAGGGGAIQRRSRVVQIAKADGTLRDASDTMTIATADKFHGGYLGVHGDATAAGSIYALYEDAPLADDSVITRVVKLDPGARSSTTLIERTLDVTRTSLWVLGVVDGGVLLARTDREVGDAGAAAGAIRSATVILLPAGRGPPRILADFAGDYPLLGLNALGHDGDWLYWLNSSGELWRFPRGALR